MPSGIVHAGCSLLLCAPAFGFIYGLTGNSLAAAGAASLGCLLGIPLTPDLDQEGLGTTENRLIKYTLGVGFVWVMLWYPYARLVPHRSPFSHWPILGTAGRLLYLSLFGLLAWQFGWRPPDVAPDLLLCGVGGLALSDAAHWLLDVSFRSRR